MRFSSLLLVLLLAMPWMGSAQNVDLQVEVIGLVRTGYADCFGCGDPDPTWEVAGDHNGGSAGEAAFCWSFPEMGGTFWDLTTSTCGGSPCADFIINATNINATNFTVDLYDAYEKNCNNDNCTYYSYDFFDCFPSVYGDDRRTNDAQTVNFRLSAPCTWHTVTTSFSGDYDVQFRYKWEFASAPTITSQPAANTVLCAGGSPTTLSVGVNNDATGGWTLGRHYQWQISERTDCAGAASWLDIPGATASSYTPQAISGTRLYRCRVTSNCGADFTSQTSTSNCARVTYQPYNGASGSGLPYATGDPAPAIQSGICGSTVLPNSVHTLGTLQPPAVDAMANASGYGWNATSGSLSGALSTEKTWTAPSTPGTATITLTYQDACAADDASVSCNVTVGSPGCDFIYVSSTSGTDAGGTSAGGPDNPYASLGYALANLDGRLHIRMENGSYAESGILQLVPDLIVEGGFTNSAGIWSKSSNASTSISFSGTEVISSDVAHVVGLKGLGDDNFKLIDLALSTVSTSARTSSGNGYSNYVLYLSGCSNYELIRCTLNSGSAASGDGDPNPSTYSSAWDGTNGGNGGVGGTGQAGECTCDWSTDNGGSGGSAGSAGSAGSNASRIGGSAQAGGLGGRGGNGRPDNTSSNGFSGSAGVSPSGSGSGAGGGGAGGSQDGGNDCDLNGAQQGGNASPAGNSGANGTTVSSVHSAGYFRPSYGTNGTSGRGGAGGGGGGGGARDTGGCDAAGGGGSGGGGGGGGGGAGAGGRGGGGAFALYLWNNGTGANIQSCTFATGSAGAGGQGGTGGNGGSGGGLSALGNCCGDGNRGNRGGAGANGGRGGDGGDAQSGARMAVAVQGGGTAPSVGGITVNVSTGGGSTPANPVLTIPYQNAKLCRNSVIEVEASTGAFTKPSGFEFVHDLNATSSSYDGGSNPVQWYTSTADQSVDVVTTSPVATFAAYLQVGDDARPVPSIGLSATEICQGEALGFSELLDWGSVTEHRWEVFSGADASSTPVYNSSLAAPTSTDFSTPGTYLVKYQQRESCCGWSIPVYTTFQVGNDQTVPVITGDQALCSGGSPASLNQTTAPTGGVGSWVYQWQEQVGCSGGFADISGATGTAFTPPSGITESTCFRLAATNNCGTVYSNVVTVTVYPNPDVSVSIGGPVCGGDSIMLGATVFSGTAPFTYAWTPAASLTDPSIANPRAFPSATTAYSLTVTDDNGCIGAEGGTLNVETAPPAATASQAFQCADNSILLTGNDPGSLSGSWSLISGSGTVNPEPTPGEATLDGVSLGDAVTLRYTISTGTGICPDETVDVSLDYLANLATPTDGTASCTPNPSGGSQYVGSPDGETLYLAINPLGNSLGTVDVERPGANAFTSPALYWSGLASPNGTYGSSVDPARMPAGTAGCPDELFVEDSWEIDVSTQPTGNDPELVLYLAKSAWDDFVSNGNDWLDATPGLRASYEGCYNGFPAPSAAPSPANATITGYHADGLSLHALSAVSYDAATDRYLLTFTTDRFSGFALHGSGSGTPLPVELVTFTGQHTAGSNHLSWITAAELNTLRFDVERSADGQAFETLGSVEAAGWSSAPRTYGYVDAGVPPGGFYYRLKVVDIDGSVEHSRTIWLSAEAGAPAQAYARLMPNPTTADTELRFWLPSEGRFTVSVRDAVGRLVFAREGQGTEGLNRLGLDLGGEPAGTYVVTLTRPDGLSQPLRLVKSTD